MTRIKPYNVIGKIMKNVKKVKWHCLHEGCQNKAIRSHLGQRKGILSQLQVDGHLIQLKTTDAHHWKKKAPIAFKKIGTKQAISLAVFCNDHDTSLFKSAELVKVDFTTYPIFLLFSYRTLCAEIRKKEIASEQNKRVIQSKFLEGKIDKDMVQKYRKGLELGIRDLEILKKHLNVEIKSPKGSFKYWHYILPRYDIFVTSVMSVFPLFHRDANEYELENLYIHFIPTAKNSILLIGYHENYYTRQMQDYCMSWGDLSENEIDIKLTDLLTNHIENWVLSPRLFDTFIISKRQKYLREFARNINHYGMPNQNKFNLFEQEQ